MNYTNDIEIIESGFMQKVSKLENELQLDPYTYKHSLNVASYLVRFLKYAKWNFDEEIVYYAGLFHDIGKTKVNRKILYKVDPLTEKEFALIKTHAIMGFRLLTTLDLQDEILSSSLYHHEQYGGFGYPYGISGTDIPEIARITSICDVFDALTMDRPYRKAYSVQEAIEIMNNSPSQFDPHLLPLFLKFLNREYNKNTVKPQIANSECG